MLKGKSNEVRSSPLCLVVFFSELTPNFFKLLLKISNNINLVSSEYNTATKTRVLSKILFIKQIILLEKYPFFERESSKLQQV